MDIAKEARQRFLEMGMAEGPSAGVQQTIGALQNAPQIPVTKAYGLGPEEALALSAQGSRMQQQGAEQSQQTVRTAMALDEQAYNKLKGVNDLLRQERMDNLNAAHMKMQERIAMARLGKDVEKDKLELEMLKTKRDSLLLAAEQERQASSITVPVDVIGADGTKTTQHIPSAIAKKAGLDVDAIYKKEAGLSPDYGLQLKPFADAGFSPSAQARLSDPKYGLQNTYKMQLQAILRNKPDRRTLKSGKYNPEAQAREQTLNIFAPYVGPDEFAILKEMLNPETKRDSDEDFGVGSSPRSPSASAPTALDKKDEALVRQITEGIKGRLTLPQK